MTDQKKEVIIVHSAVYPTEYTNKYRNRVNWEEPNFNHIYSFIPGTIIDVFVKTGQKVKKGEVLLILEAMKMHNNVEMPFDGKIVKINIKAGDKIPKKYLMIEIKPI